MNSSRRSKILFFLFITLVSCNKDNFLFEQIDSSASGIDFSNRLDENSKLNIFNYLYYYNGSGVAAGDYNNDGLTDLYFTANEAADKLYLNMGDFRFAEVTAASHIQNSDGWTTGISNVDINNDGLLDLYICKVSDVQGLKGHNLLYVNKGIDKSGIPFFEEQSAKYGLDFSGFSTQSVFLDYDLDGDLDMYLLNHSIHPNRNYGRGVKRNSFDPKSGDRFFRNDNGKFTDVSSETGIFQGVIGYGLGIGVGDLNNDLYPDIYVGNDFFENDYLYINQQNGTFKDIISENPENLGHTTHFSMGNDIADINNDGLQDILSLDMLPKDLSTYKTSGLEYPFQTYANYLKNGFSPQYMQNTLHINSGDLNFSETAFLSGIAASEWSWGALFADFDNDSNKDLFISNGIKGATNDMDFIRYISNEKIQKKINEGEMADYSDLIKELPEKKVANCIFQNMGDNTFKDRRKEWLNASPTFSHGVVYADLDNDGDLDLVVNNMDEEAGVFKNNSDRKKDKSNYLDIKFKGGAGNLLGIGAKVMLYYNDNQQLQEHYLSRGYLSSLAPGLHFGLGKTKKIDSVQVIWPDLFSETRYNVQPNTAITFDYKEAKKYNSSRKQNNNSFLTLKDSLIDYRHTEQSTLEFNRDLLIPFAYSNLSPGATVGDINGDGREDLVIGGGKTQPLGIWIQDETGKLNRIENKIFEEASISENADQVFTDVDSDGDLDLIVVSGGNEFKRGTALRPRLYLNDNGNFTEDHSNFQNVFINASRVTAVDLNNDGYEDVCFSSNIEPTHYGFSPKQYLFLNDGKGKFSEVTEDFSKEFQNAGMVQDIVWKDINNDNFKDAVFIGHWMPVKIFLNDGKKLTLLETNLEKSNGWWNSLEVADFDKDGDMDIVAGNWGLNSRLTASAIEPIKLYLNDFDGNGSIDPVMTYFYEGEETAFSSKDELDKQMPFLKKKYPNYSEYSTAEFSELFPKEKLEKAELKEAYELGSCYFENLGNNKFKKRRLAFEAQVSTVFDIESYDFNKDGYLDIFIVGNNYEISTQLGRLDASHGTLLINDKNGGFEVSKLEIPDISGPARDIQKISIHGKDHFIITFNNAQPIFLQSYNPKDL